MNKFPLTFLSDYSDPAILSEIQRVAFVVKKAQLTKKDFDYHSKVSSSTVLKRFGSWAEALKKAGLSDRYSGKSVTKKQILQAARSWSDKKLLEELVEISKKKGCKVITREDIDKYSEPHSSLKCNTPAKDFRRSGEIQAFHWPVIKPTFDRPDLC